MKKIISKTPANKTAALVTGKGVHYTPKNNPDTESPFPIKTRKLTKQEMMNPTFRNFTGFEIGRLIFIGMGVNKHRWIARCVCGTYVTRKAKTVGKNIGGFDACSRCLHNNRFNN